MVERGVHAAGGVQTVKVQRRALFNAVVHRLVVGGIFKERTVLDRAGDARQVLEHDAAAADVGMADLAVAHLARGQAHVKTGGLERRVGILGKKAVEHGGVGRAHRVADGIVGQAEAVHDDQRGGSLIHRFSSLLLVGSVDDLHQCLGVERSAADQAAVDVLV